MAMAVDAMGGDRAPAAIVEGSIEAVSNEWCPEIVLVGDESAIESRLEREFARLSDERVDALRQKISIHHAPETIRMDESPVLALRRKPDSSIRGCVELVVEGRADAIVTAGNTGATVAATKRHLPIANVRRPGIAVTLPSKHRVSTIIDVGANVHCKPSDLFDYGVMATQFCRAMLEIEKPSIGLMNVGEEDDKGNELVRQTQDLFRRSSLNFIGNVEGQDAFSGKCDIIVCEGFVGNVILKVSEGFAEMTVSWMQDMIQQSAQGEGKATWQDALRRFEQHTDYATYGGALLLGVDTTCVICHGRSNPLAIANAIRSAAKFVECGVRERVLEGLAEHRNAAGRTPGNGSPVTGTSGPRP